MYKPSYLISVYIDSDFINSSFNKFWETGYNYTHPKHSLFKIFDNIIHVCSSSDIKLIQKIDLVHKPFKII